MKFSDLNLKDRFTIPDNEKTWTKRGMAKPTCCTPAHNAFSRDPDGSRKSLEIKKIADDQEVTLVEEDDVPKAPTQSVPVKRNVRENPEANGGGSFGSPSV